MLNPIAQSALKARAGKPSDAQDEPRNGAGISKRLWEMKDADKSVVEEMKGHRVAGAPRRLF